ncbi:unnamed protein product, partial [Mesorhabditis spiculigera]
MGLQAHAVASSDGWLRPLFWFSARLLQLLALLTSKLRNFLDLPFDDPLNLSPAMLRNHHRIRRQEKDCPTRRQFICYAYDVVEEPYPDWLQNTRPRSSKAFDPSGDKFTSQYWVQCDAGFIVPTFVSTAYTNWNGELLERPALTCTYDRNRVEADLMLDCRTNVFFKASGAGGPKLTPPSCDGDDDVRICKGRTEPTTIAPSASGPNEDESGLGLRLAVAAAVVGICLLAAVATVESASSTTNWRNRCRNIMWPQNVELAWQPYGGSWEARFYRKVTGQPPKVKPSSLGYSLKGHLALCMKSEKLNPGVPWPLNGKGCPIPSTNEPIRDPVVVAETLLSALAQDNLVTVYNCGPTKLFDNNDLIALFNHAKSMQAQVKSVVHLTGPTWVVGDIHGDFNVLWRMFDAYGRTALPGQNIVFLGDVVDRGARQMMCLVLIVASMVLHPKQVFYIAGNHETPYCYNQYGFSTQIKDEQKYSAETFAAIEGFFKSLPRVGTIDKRILVVHGGIPPRMTTEQLRNGFDPNDESAELTRLRLSLQWNDPCNGGRWSRVAL